MAFYFTLEKSQRGALVARLIVVTAVATMLVHAAPARAETGAAVVAWGSNVHAELAAGYQDTFEESPVPVLGLSDVTALANGSEFSLALLSDGTVRAWGNNGHGQLGDGTAGRDTGTWAKGSNYVTVAGLSNVKAIAAANSHALALLENGTVEAWGNNNYGQLGNGQGGVEKETGERQSVPKVIEGLTGVIAIASGGGSNFALLNNHTVTAWGENAHGQLGIGALGPEACTNEIKQVLPCSTRPRMVLTASGKPLEHVAAISAGQKSTYALLTNGHVMAWGANTMGQLGTGGPLLHVNLVPEEVKSASTGAALGGVAEVSAGAFDALALLGSGQTDGWGAVGKGELGTVVRPQACKKIRCLQTARPIKGLEHLDVSDVSAGEGYSLVVSSGRVYSLGTNEHGELGDGSISSTTTPTPVEGLGAVSSVLAGSADGAGKTHALALLQDGVQPPPVALSVEPGIGSLKLLWRMRAEAYVLQYNPSRRESCEAVAPGEESSTCEENEEVAEVADSHRKITLGEQADSFEFTGLEAQPYTLIIKSTGKHRLEKKRVIRGTPLS
jgi:alpha-tubulin suppressor-like RCC1 family protein